MPAHFCLGVATTASRSKSQPSRRRQEQRAGDFESARAVFRRGLARKPDAAGLVLAWGLLESRLGPARRARRLLDRAARLDPAHNLPVTRWRCVERLSVAAPEPPPAAAPAAAACVRRKGEWVAAHGGEDRDPGRWVREELRRLRQFDNFGGFNKIA